MTPKEKAKELIDQFWGLVYPYFGSSMLTNDTDDRVILRNSKTCALITVEESLYILKQLALRYDVDTKADVAFLGQVKEEIINYEIR